MSYDHLHNHIQQIAARVANTIAHPRFATVLSVDPASHAVKVRIEPEGVLTGWLPVVATGIGNGWGFSRIHAPGDQVVVMPTQNSLENGVVLGGVFSDDQLPATSPAAPNATPTPGQAGETLISAPNGTGFFRLCADGSIMTEGIIWHHKGDFHVDGDIFDKVGKLDGLRQNYNQHLHSGVQTGGGQTETTTIPDPGASAPSVDDGTA